MAVTTRKPSLDALVASMTLEDKLGQLNVPLPWPRPGADPSPPTDVQSMERFVAGTYCDDLGPGGGVYMLPHPHADATDQAALSNRLQRAARRTRLGIPMLQIVEGNHGVIAPGHTVFPQGPGLGSSWDVDLVGLVFAAIAREARAVGFHMLSTIVAEPIRDPRLGRNCQGFTEDPFLLGRYVAALVSGAQGDDLAADDKAIALLTCFPGQSEPVSGLERGAMEISERTLREVFLPAWVEGITRAGALGVMATYASVDGHVAHGSSWLLTEILRDELGFEGIVVSEGSGFETLIYEGIVDSQSDAGAMSIRAGVDVNITWEAAFLEPLRRNVVEGRVPVELVDRAVRRVLDVKQRLGLFDEPFVDEQRAPAIVHCDDHVEIALRAARGGIVLLKNDEDLLPLSKSVTTIAVIGPNADNAENQLGDYTMAMVGGADLLPPVVTVLDGIRAVAGSTVDVRYAKGCEILGDDTSGFEEAVELACRSDVAVVVVGEQQGSVRDPSNPTTVGEMADVASLDLTGVQQELIEAVHATGTDTIVVLINGRALSTRWIAANVPALVEAWLPGEQGGRAIAEILFGDEEPTGRLPVTIPRHVGQLPVFYNQRRAKIFIRESGMHFGRDYIDLPASPLFEFGFGLSYTRFEYANLRVDPANTADGLPMRVSVDVTNVGGRDGTEVVQVYVTDVLASIAPRIRQLRAFRKVAIAAGESVTLTFDLDETAFQMLDHDLRWVIEPGDFEVQVGASSSDIRQSSRITLGARRC